MVSCRLRYAIMQIVYSPALFKASLYKKKCGEIPITNIQYQKNVKVQISKCDRHCEESDVTSDDEAIQSKERLLPPTYVGVAMTVV